MEPYKLVLDRRLMEWLLTGYWEFPEASKILTGVSPEHALMNVKGIPYTISTLTSHMHWWQSRRLMIAQGMEPDDIYPPKDDWPAVASGEWNGLVMEFLKTSDDLLAITDNPDALDKQVFGDRTVGSMLVSHACHNAYHLGQIVMMRRLLGIWELHNPAG